MGGKPHHSNPSAENTYSDRRCPAATGARTAPPAGQNVDAPNPACLRLRSQPPVEPTIQRPQSRLSSTVKLGGGGGRTNISTGEIPSTHFVSLSLL